jgi:predicted permease
MNFSGLIRKLWQSRLPRTSRDVEEEFQFTLESYQNDLMDQGVPEEEARRKARIDLGQLAGQNETYRRVMGLRVLDELSGDVRYGFRGLRRNPGFATVAMLSLALGIGATTAMFSLIYAVLLHPFPYADAGRVMNLFYLDEERPDAINFVSLSKPQFDLLSQAPPVDSVLGFRPAEMEITGGALPEDVLGMYLTENAASFLGVRPLLGRNIERSDAENGGHSVVVLNYQFWLRRFGGDPHVVGQTLEINHAPYTVIGVMPRNFAFNDFAVGDVYLLMPAAGASILEYLPWIKLKPNVTRAAANSALEPLVREFSKEKSGRLPEHWHLALQPIIWTFQQEVGRTLKLLLGGVLLLLMIGCANCSILLLARGRARHHELAIRKAIGASRWRIVRQLLVEAMVISCTGAVLGVAASYWLAKLPLLLAPKSFPAESVIRINAPVLAFSVAVALLCGLLFGLVPALRLSRRDSAPMFTARNTGVTSAVAGHRWSFLITAQVALTLLLMATAGTAIQSFVELLRAPLGYDPANVMQVGIRLHFRVPAEWDRVQSREARMTYIEQIRDKIATVPGVSQIGTGTFATPPYSGNEYPVEIDRTVNGEQPKARIIMVDQRYFVALGIPQLQGRAWDQDENNRGDFIAVVNQAFAAKYLSQSAALGRRLRISGLTPRNRFQVTSQQSTAWRQIIGVVGDARNDGLEHPVLPAIYLPYTSVMDSYAQFFVRTQGDPQTYLQTIRAAIASVAPDQQVGNGGLAGTFTLNEALQRAPQYSAQRLLSILFSVFSAMALALALVGIFSLVAYSVAQRTVEFGVRMALGAPRRHVLFVAARIALASTAIGIVIGLAAESYLGAVLSRWMQNTFAVRSLFAAAVLLGVSALLACLLPARHAVQVSPSEALRYE